MLLWVGLGNPGEKYAGNRHNIGFMVMDEMVRHYNFPAPKSQFKGMASQGMIEGHKVLLLKPMTFMNESGRSVQAAMQFYKIPLENVTTFHDELDLDFGKIRQKVGGGVAGHNGLRSIKQHCGNDFARVRIGIDHPGDKARVHGHVLSDFRKDEADMRDDIIDGLARHAGLLATDKKDLYQTRVAEYVKR